jgi:dienelactone hydrolase
MELDIRLSTAHLRGDLKIPERAKGLVLFAHGSGSGRHSPRNRVVASALNSRGIATLLFDLLTIDEERFDNERGGRLRFDVELLGGRLAATTEWVASRPDANALPIGYFGASTGAAAALIAAAAHGERISAVVSRGGRPDLAGLALPQVAAATLLIAGENDPEVIVLNQQAYARLTCEKRLVIVPGASHLFEEPGTLMQVVAQAAAWFERYLPIPTGVHA